MITPTLKALIDESAGAEGFWKSDTATTLYESAEKLVALGMTEADAAEFLDRLYSAVRDEYGD